MRPRRCAPSPSAARRAAMAGLALVPMIVGGCSAVSDSLQVYAAASMTESMGEMARAFTAAYGTRVELSFGGSQLLATQILEGAPADVFISADRRQMDRVADEFGMTPSDIRALAANTLVIVTPADNPARVDGLADLAQPGVRVVLAGPDVPAGAYARQLLAGAEKRPGMLDDLAGRVLANTVSQELDVEGVVAKVALGEADVGIVYATDTRGTVGGDLHVVPLPEGWSPMAQYWMTSIPHAGAPDANPHAADFTSFALSTSGQTILRTHGLMPPGDEASGDSP